MKDKAITILTKMIDLLHQTGWAKQSEWYELKLKLLVETDENLF